MAGEKRFRTGVFGFRKKDVNTYVVKMLEDFENKLRDRDAEIASLKSQLKEVKSQYEEIAATKEQISQVLIDAREEAGKFLEKVRLDAEDERKKLERQVEAERERLVDARNDVMKFRSVTEETFREFIKRLENVVEEG